MWAQAAMSTRLIKGNCVVKAVKTQVRVQGEAGKELWLGVRLGRKKGTIVGWMHSGELQRKAGGDKDWEGRLRGKGREGWNVQEQRWESWGVATGTGHGIRGEVVGWYMPVSVVDEKKQGCYGVRVVVRMRRVVIGRTAGS